MAIIFKLTDTGRAALINAANSGTLARTVVSIGVTATAFTPLPTLTNIPNEIKRIATIAGDVVADDTVHVTVSDDGSDAYSVRGVGLWLDNGVLLGTYSQADVIVEKSGVSIMMLAFDLRVLDGSVDISTLQFGSTDFLNPPATTERQGVVELATAAEAAALADSARALTPASVAELFNARALTTTTLDAGTGLTGGGDLTENRTLALADTAVVAASYGAAALTPTFKVDAQGRLTAAGTVPTQAVKFSTPRTIALAGAVTGTATAFDGSANISIATTAINAEHAGITGLLGGDHGGVPTGTVIHVAGSVVPAGYLKANGAAVSRTVYAALFAAVGTTYGAGDGNSTFNVPDMRGEFVRGWDDSRGIDSGRARGSFQKPTLVGGYDDDASGKNISVIYNKGLVDYGSDAIHASLYPGAVAAFLTAIAEAPTAVGPGMFSAVRPRNVALLAVIKF